MYRDLATIRHQREREERLLRRRRRRLERCVSTVRLIVTVPLVLGAAWLFWRIGYESGLLAGCHS